MQPRAGDSHSLINCVRVDVGLLIMAGVRRVTRDWLVARRLISWIIMRVDIKGIFIDDAFEVVMWI